MESQEAGQAAAECSALIELFKTHRHKCLEIEILPSEIAPPLGSLLLIDQECIGIPKGVLVKAFLQARKLFQAASQQVRRRTFSSPQS